MRFAFIPKAQYRIGQIIGVQGRKMRVESYTHIGRNLIACTLDTATKFERVVCICTDSLPVTEVSA